ncbi:glycosyltransferase family 2 protein [Polaribacter sp. ALD11]|uniref:glycosyltransferase family 2 protein n=1 Tax=Polaribacter sp. ALD11 TaxID=2058137 RepID=UPI000C31344D|nr:glycosyltransferase [Polaribacter sp. ALD11]AUC84425.1 glycosyltransferase family 2 protein [Polaribacter sp. ALD11]
MLAIVIPYYNYQYFKETLDSLSDQTNKKFIVYIGNDASNNDPLLLLKKYKFNFIYKKFETNLGSISLVKQWERCIEMTKNEEWIQILGDDDILDINFVSAFYDNIEEINSNNIDVIRFASRYIDNFSRPLKEYSDFHHPKIELASDSFFRKYKGNSRSSLSEHIFRREVYKKYNFFEYPLAWYSDDRAWLDFSNFKNIYTINDSIVSVRVTNVSISGQNSNYFLKKKARHLFFKYLVYSKLFFFSKNQKIEFLLEFGIQLKEQHKINSKNILYITFQLFRIGAYVSMIKFIRRMYIAKYKNLK